MVRRFLPVFELCCSAVADAIAHSRRMSVDEPDITDPIDVARLAFSAEDGAIQGDLTWQSYVDVFLTASPWGMATLADSATGSSTSGLHCRVQPATVHDRVLR